MDSLLNVDTSWAWHAHRLQVFVVVVFMFVQWICSDIFVRSSSFYFNRKRKSNGIKNYLITKLRVVAIFKTKFSFFVIYMCTVFNFLFCNLFLRISENTIQWSVFLFKKKNSFWNKNLRGMECTYLYSLYVSFHCKQF